MPRRGPLLPSDGRAMTCSAPRQLKSGGQSQRCTLYDRPQVVYMTAGAKRQKEFREAGGVLSYFATRLQALARGHAARGEAAGLRSQRERAATRLQAAFRGHRSRQETAAQRAELEAIRSLNEAKRVAAGKIQRLARSWLERMNAARLSAARTRQLRKDIERRVDELYAEERGRGAARPNYADIVRRVYGEYGLRFEGGAVQPGEKERIAADVTAAIRQAFPPINFNPAPPPPAPVHAVNDLTGLIRRRPPRT